MTRTKPGNTCASKGSLDVARRRGSGTGKLSGELALLGEHARVWGVGGKEGTRIHRIAYGGRVRSLSKSRNALGLRELRIKTGVHPTYFLQVVLRVPCDSLFEACGHIGGGSGYV